MLRDRLTLLRAPRRIDLADGPAWLRVPTAGDAVEAEGKAVAWFLCRFLCNEDGSPVFREDEQALALKTCAYDATRIVEEVGRLMQSPPHAGEAAALPPRLETRDVCGGGLDDDCG